MKISFDRGARDSFASAVRANVDAYFKENNISKRANASMVGKTTFLLSSLVLFYVLIVFAPFSLWVKLPLAIGLGAIQALIGFNVCHDAIHGSYSNSKMVNNVLSKVFNVIGANAYVWKLSHNVVHHTYTNIPGHDSDLEVAPGLIKLSHSIGWRKVMRYQHIYAFVLYALTSIHWVFIKDYKKFFERSIASTANSNHPKVEYFNLFFFKAIYYTLFIVMPLVFMDIAVWQYIIGFVLMHVAEGAVLGLVFQLAHVVEGTEFPEPDDNGHIENCWFEHQMLTTANFGRKSALTTFLCGGLNYQIEHHLFPNICHIHYPAISDIVKDTATSFNLPYHENESWFMALGSHYRMLKSFGKEVPVPTPQVA